MYFNAQRARIPGLGTTSHGWVSNLSAVSKSESGQKWQVCSLQTVSAKGFSPTLPKALGSARHAGPDRGFRPALVGEDRDRPWAVHRVARHHRQQVLRLAGTLRKSERAQRL